MIKKCDFTGCTKTGTCRAPKARDLKEYWFFCREHAADYNKNWDFYANMTPEDIEADWERRVFGTAEADKTKSAADNADYVKFINDFITGRGSFDRVASSKSIPSGVHPAFKIFDLPITASWREVGAAYRFFAKKYHPDTAKNKKTAASKFAEIGDAYALLKKYFKK